MTNELPPYEADRWGFPIEECRRCSGLGRIPAYGNVYGGVCFGCDGKRKTYATRAVAGLAAVHSRWMRDRTEVSLCSRLQLSPTVERVTDISEGDTIREWGVSKPYTWRTVASVRVLADVCGLSQVGSDTNPTTVRALTQRVRVTFTDGSTVRGWGETWIRALSSDEARAHAAPLVERAVASYRKTLARRR